MKTRREFMRALVVGGLAVPLLELSWPDSVRGGPGEIPPPNPIDGLFPGFDGLTVEEKIRRIETFTVAARTDPSGIFVCMPKLTAVGPRRVRLSDFDGMDPFSENFGLRFKSVTDFFDNENSVTTSGSHLAAQCFRFQASGDPDALVAARRAYASLRRIYALGAQHGRAGFMGKPYHFEYSPHTTGDQYLHMLWGLWTFRTVASPAEQSEIHEMIRTCADYMIAADFTLHYEDGRSWNMREDPTDYNAIMAALVAAAHHLTGERKYRDAYLRIMRTGKWMARNRLDLTIAEVRDGTWKTPPWEFLAGTNERPGEFLHWEQIQHCQFAAIAAAIIHESVPDLFSDGNLSDTLSLWWEDYGMGFDRAYWGYLYWFFVSTHDRSWRPCPRTRRVPREEWFAGHPMLSFTSSWIYGDCLSRFLWTAMVVVRHCPPRRAEAAAFAAETLRHLGPHHLLWIADPDRKQIPPSLRYFTEFLSSEAPEGFIASYWEGRRLKLWT